MSIALHRPPKPFVPWAEVVPGAPFPMTVQDLLAWPGNDGYRYELVDGVLVRVAGSGDEATTIGTTIVGELYAFVRPRRMGIVTGADGVYKFPGAETGLVPDVGYYGAGRRALMADRKKPIPFTPELAVEVASPDQSPDAMAAKARTYLAGGTRLVWIVWPSRQEVEVWHADEASGPVVHGANDMLDGADVVPGFTCPVARVFADPLD